MDPDATDTSVNNGGGDQPSEDDEWGSAIENLLADKGVEKEEEKPVAKNDDSELTPEEKKAAEDEAAKKAEEEEAAKKEAELAKNETPEQTEARHKEEEAKKAAEDKDPVNTQQPPQATREQIIEQEKAIRKDIWDKMFSDTPDKLYDPEGREIRDHTDVMQYINKRTGKPFTEEEAARWILDARNDLNETRAENEARVEELAELQMNLKEQADAVKEKYGPLLDELDKTIPNFKKNLWDKFSQTLKRDKTTDIIIDAPTSLDWFYSTVLAPYEASNTILKAAEDEATKAKKEAEDLKAKQDRADRGDIYQGGPAAEPDEDDDEWGKAFKKHYEGTR